MDERRPTRGRRGPRTFDRDEALLAAMRLFWRNGYEGTSISDLTVAIGIAPPSLYAAFGSKAELYRAALDRYDAEFGALEIGAIASARSLPDAVRILLEGAIRAVTDPDRERGCMVSSGMTACHPDHASLAQDLALRREAMRHRIAEALLKFGGAERVRPLSRHIAAVMQGISIQARDGATPSELQEIADNFVACSANDAAPRKERQHVRR